MFSLPVYLSLPFSCPTLYFVPDIFYSTISPFTYPLSRPSCSSFSSFQLPLLPSSFTAFPPFLPFHACHPYNSKSSPTGHFRPLGFFCFPHSSELPRSASLRHHSAISRRSSDSLGIVESHFIRSRISLSLTVRLFRFFMTSDRFSALHHSCRHAEKQFTLLFFRFLGLIDSCKTTSCRFLLNTSRAPLCRRGVGHFDIRQVLHV